MKLVVLQNCIVKKSARPMNEFLKKRDTKLKVFTLDKNTHH